MPVDNLRTLYAATFGRVTATAGTLVNRLIPPYPTGYTRIMAMVYTAGATAHTLTALRAIGQTTIASAAAASQAVINLTAQPATSNGGPTNNVAANDYLVWKNDDGTYSFDLVASVSSLAITMTSSLSKAAAAGNPVWFLGVLADVNTDGLAHPVFTCTASATTTNAETTVGVCQTIRPNEPILLQSNNATNAGVLERVSVAYTSV